MSVPYEPVIRHEVAPFTDGCGPCVYATANKPCGLDWCNCTCNLQASAPVALEDIVVVDLHDEVIVPPEEPVQWDESPVADPQRGQWFEPPTKPEDIESWTPGPITIPRKDEWIVFPTPEKSDNITLLRVAVVLLALVAVTLTFLSGADWLGKTILIVLSTVAVVLALLSTQ